MCRGHFLAACIGLLLSWYYHGLSVATEPGFLDFDNLPETNFSCEGKVIGGYYADTETGCQMFHVCTIGQKGEVTDIKFLCLNGTVFDQETRVCERLDEVDCSKSESFYDLNLELYGNHAAGFGIQPESEDSPDNLCEEEDEEECQTEEPPSPVKPSEHRKSSGDERKAETTTQPPLSSSTTSQRPVTSTSFPSTTPAPQILQFPSSSPETIAALLALHNAFTQSLQQHSNGKDKVNPPKITGFVESLNPIKSTQEAETFEIKSGQSFSSRVPTPFPPKTQTQYSVPPSKSQYQNPPKPQFQSSKPQFTSPLKPQFQNPPRNNYQSPPKSQFQPQPKPPAPITHPPVTFPKPIHTTSERFGNIPFRHSFHINSQVTHFHEPNYHDQYSDHESHPSSQPQTEAPKQYDFGDYEDDYYDEKPHSSTITPYLIHQLKVNQVQSANQAKVSESSNHGSFVREVSSSSSKPFNVPSYRSVTTPGIAIITATSTTSSSSVKTGKPLPSAIQPFKKHPTGTGFGDSLLNSPNSNDTEHFLDTPQSYDDYKEGDVRSDPFYKDVPKISRSKRNIENDVDTPDSITTLDYTSLRKLKNKLKNSAFKLNSEDLLRAILNEYCNSKVNSSDSLISYCTKNNHDSSISDKSIGNEWTIVIPKGNADFLYLVKTVTKSNEYQNFTSNILLLVHFPSEFKLIRDSIIKEIENEKDSTNLLKLVETNSVNSSIHHRFKRVRRQKSMDHKNKTSKIVSSWEKLRGNQLLKLTRLKRQVESRPHYENSGGELINVPYEKHRVRPVVRERESSSNENQQRTRKVVRKRPHSVEHLDEAGPQVNQRRPTRRRQPTSQAQSIVQSSLSAEIKHEDNYPQVSLDRSKYSSQRRQPSVHPSVEQTAMPLESVEEQGHLQQEFHTLRHEVVPPQRIQHFSAPQSQASLPLSTAEEENHSQRQLHSPRHSQNILAQRRQPSHSQSVSQSAMPLERSKGLNYPQVEIDDSKSSLPTSDDKTLERPSAGRRKQGIRYHFCEGPRCSEGEESAEGPDKEVEVSTTYPFNLKPGTAFNCDDKIKGGYYADVEAECYGYFICSQGAIGGPLLKSHFWCGPTTKFNQRSRTCQAEANVACSVSHRYFHLNKDILSLPDPDDLVRDSFEPSKVKS